MPTTGNMYASTVSVDDVNVPPNVTNGDIAYAATWTGATNAQGDTTGSYANSNASLVILYSRYLYAVIPHGLSSTSTITNISFQFFRYYNQDTSGTASDNAVYLVKNGTIVGSNLASGSWPEGLSSAAWSGTYTLDSSAIDAIGGLTGNDTIGFVVSVNIADKDNDASISAFRADFTYEEAQLDTGYISFTSSTSVDLNGSDTAWTTPENAIGSDDSWAQCINFPNTTEQLTLTGADLSIIPATALIDQIDICIERSASDADTGHSGRRVEDTAAYLIVDGSNAGNNASLGVTWPVYASEAVYVFTFDSAALTAAGIVTAADIQSNFGFSIVASENRGDGDVTARVDDVQVKVYYTLVTQMIGVSQLVNITQLRL